MVSLEIVRASNAKLTTSLPTLVAVFVGATSGIGEYSLKAFAKHTSSPRVYFVGRSNEAGARLVSECKALNPSSDFIFISADLTLIRNVDEVCRQIKAREKYINVLFQSQGTLFMGSTTEEKLHDITAVTYYSKVRFTLNLLPLLCASSPSGLKRVVTSFTGGKEGPVYPNDFQGYKVPVRGARGHISSMVTLSMEAMKKEAPDVSFVHAFPGFVKTNLVRGGEGFSIATMGLIFKIVSRFGTCVSNDECGERHLFLATSAMYPAREVKLDGVEIRPDLAVAVGIDGMAGSGVYSVYEKCESASVVQVLKKLRNNGADDQIWEHTTRELKRVDGELAS